MSFVFTATAKPAAWDGNYKVKSEVKGGLVAVLRVWWQCWGPGDSAVGHVAVLGSLWQCWGPIGSAWEIEVAMKGICRSISQS